MNDRTELIPLEICKLLKKGKGIVFYGHEPPGGESTIPLFVRSMINYLEKCY